MDVLNHVLNRIDDGWHDEVEFLQKLGRFPSTLGHEFAVQRFMAQAFRDLGLDTDEFIRDLKKLSAHPAYSPVEWTYEGRPIVVGTWAAPGPKKGKSLILQGHIDVVSAEPVRLWNYDPWGSTIEGNRMYGRGIADMKAGIAAMIYAIKAIKDSGIELDADLQLQSVHEEECTGNGALATLIQGYTADGALIPEPFGLNGIVVAQVGLVWLRVRIVGTGAHSISAGESISPIDKAYLLIDSLKKYREKINREPKHPAFEHIDNPLAVYIGTLHSGDWPASMPSECTFEARIGLYPDRDPQDIKDEVRAWLSDAAAGDPWLKEHPPEITFYGQHAPGVSLDKNLELFQALRKSHKGLFGSELEDFYMTCSTDIRVYNLFGAIPATCYGPIGANYHAPNEWVDLQSVKDCTKAYAAFILDWCGVRNEGKP
jgi:acetylornithine deacetylase